MTEFMINILVIKKKLVDNLKVIIDKSFKTIVI